MTRFTMQQEMTAHSVAVEHIEWCRARGQSDYAIAQSVGLAPSSRSVLAANLGRIWLDMQVPQSVDKNCPRFIAKF